MTGDHVIHWRAAQWTKSGIVGQWRITSVHFPKSPFELSRLRGGRYAYAKDAAFFASR